MKYLNNVIEQDHRAVRRRWRAMQGFRSFHTAERTLEGIESSHMTMKSLVKRLDGRDTIGQAKFVESLFGITAQRKARSSSARLNSFLATEPGGRNFFETSPRPAPYSVSLYYLTDTVTVGGSVFINIDPSSGLPIYLQIVQQIKTAVAMGRLQPEAPCPPSGSWRHFPDFPERSLKTRL